MSEFTFTKTPAPANETIVHCGNWRASFIHYPFTEGNAWVFAAREGEGRFLFGPLTETGFLVILREKSTDEQIVSFLKDCMAGKVSERGLADLQIAITE